MLDLVVRFRCSPYEYDVLRDAAQMHNMSMSEFLRFLIRLEVLDSEVNLTQELQLKEVF